MVSTSSSTRLQRVTERVQGARPRRTHLPLRSVKSFSMAARADVFGTWERWGIGLRDMLRVWGSVKGGLDSLSYLDWSEFPQKQQ